MTPEPGPAVLTEADEAERKLAAILSADVVGFTRMIGADEADTLDQLTAARRLVIDPILTAHRGRIFKVMGDGLLVEFASAVMALRAAIAIQSKLVEHGAAIPPDRRIVLRMGLHQGDVVVHGSDLLGDGVNIAARLQPLAEPGGICLSARVQEDAAGKVTHRLHDGGVRTLKNVGRQVQVFLVQPASAAPIEEQTITAIARPVLGRLTFLETVAPGPPVGHVVILSDTALVLGRQAPADLVLPNGEVSRLHCRIERAGAAVVAVDLQSTNGTFVDGRRIEEATPLGSGVLVRIGPFVMRFMAGGRSFKAEE